MLATFREMIGLCLFPVDHHPAAPGVRIRRRVSRKALASSGLVRYPSAPASRSLRSSPGMAEPVRARNRVIIHHQHAPSHGPTSRAHIEPMSFATARNALTIRGSHQPWWASASTAARAAARGKARRYGRSVVRASKTSTT